MKRFASDRVAGLMERMGLEDDVAIESRLVGKTIESAQSRVEGFNFDMRKRVVEYDDVINKQRETIYAERDKVLRNEDLTETVRAFLDEEIEALVDQPPRRRDRDDWGMEGLAAALRRWASTTSPAPADDELWELGSRDAIREHLRDARRRAARGEGERRSARRTGRIVERLVLLRTIDSLWVEHLTELDDMRRGIGLRGYAQQDPLNEFRREAFQLYEELRGLIRHQVASAIFRVTVTRQPPPRRRRPSTPVPAAGAGSGCAAVPRPRHAGAAAGRGSSGSGAATAGSGRPARPGAARSRPRVGGLAADPMARALRESTNGAAGAGGGVQAGYTPTGARIGRNDPCWCGSGLKYKKCHGR